MNDEFPKLQSDFRTYKNMTVSLAKNMDKLENEIPSVKKSIEGFDGRMLVMAVKIVELQERIEAIEESSHDVKSKKTRFYDNWNLSKLKDAIIPPPRDQEGQSLQENLEVDQTLIQFISQLEEKNKGNITK
jgi:hypothetical protein